MDAMDLPPEEIEARFLEACLLESEGNKEEAKAAYLALLQTAPMHFGTLNNLGNLLYATGFTSAAKLVYEQAIALHPDNPKTYVNLGNLLAATRETRYARECFMMALQLDPDHIEANRGMAYLLTEQRDEAEAALYRDRAFSKQHVIINPYRGNKEPIRVLLLASARGGMIPLQHHFGDQVFQLSILFTEYFDCTRPLPPHDYVFNGIGDVDLGREGLEAGARIVAQTNAPVINPPCRILPTGRVENARELKHIDGVVTAETLRMPRAALQGEEAVSMLGERGMAFPLLLRAPGYHTGRFFDHAGNARELQSALSNMPGEEILVMRYLDARGADGKSRKYRVMLIGGVIYPLHLAVSHDWKVHYFTSGMAENAGFRAEEAAFLNDMEAVLGARAMRGLAGIAETLALDYAGIDFGINANGEVLLFEANATMVVYPVAGGEKWDYRRTAVQRILDAIQALLMKPMQSDIPLPSPEALLVSGGDARIAIGEHGVNKYGCAVVPAPEVLAYGSCTASTISADALSASLKVYRRLADASFTYTGELQRIRAEFAALMGLDSLPGMEIIFGASGTDVHLLIALLLQQYAPSLTIFMPEAPETGSGIGSALEGRHFSTRTAHGGGVTQGEAIAGTPTPDMRMIAARKTDGSLRPMAETDAEVHLLAEETIAAGRHVLLVLTDQSKTGLIFPSPDCAFDLQKRFPAQLDILVDACQFRLCSATLRRYIEHGCMVAITGSKFITGPAFSGMALIAAAVAERLRHAALPATLGDYSARAEWATGWSAATHLTGKTNYGLLLRWEAALAELRAFVKLPEADIFSFAQAFKDAVRQRLKELKLLEPLPLPVLSRGMPDAQRWDQVPNIFPFLPHHGDSGKPFSREETRALYQMMQKDMSGESAIPQAMRMLARLRCLPGQPVACGERDGISVSALRLCLDMRLITRALSEGEGKAVIDGALKLLDKAALLVRHWRDLRG